MGKKHILLILFFLIGNQVINSQSRTENLPVIDFSRTYPKKEKNLQDISDIEYIKLETTDNVLLSDRAALSYVSDNYILVHEPERGDIFVFNRSGAIVSHFNHKGQSGREYIAIRDEAGSSGTILDEKNEEIFVCFRSIQVYSLSGEYKRTLPVNVIQNRSKVFNFDDEALLVYEDVIMDIDKPSATKTNPYSLISKKDGSLISVLDIHLPERNAIHMTQTLSPTEGKSIQIYFPSSMYYGQDFVIADISSDTLYLLTQNKKLTPLLTRKPSAHASDLRIVWTTQLTTDKFVLIGKLPIDFSGGSGRVPSFMYEFETGEISEMSILDLHVELRRSRRWGPMRYPAIDKNMTAELIWPSYIINAYKAKQLKGDIEKFAKTLDEDDNPVVRIIKFKRNHPF